MACSYCRSQTHNILTCSHALDRKAFTHKAGKRCQCCGRYGQEIHRHHSKGRNNNGEKTSLDLCLDCHIACGHLGDFKNIPIKPEVCRMYDRISFWRT